MSAPSRTLDRQSAAAKKGGRVAISAGVYCLFLKIHQIIPLMQNHITRSDQWP